MARAAGEWEVVARAAGEWEMVARAAAGWGAAAPEGTVEESEVGVLSAAALVEVAHRNG